MRKPHLVILVRHELVSEAQREVCVNSFTSPVIVVQEGVVVVLVGLHLLDWLAFVVALSFSGNIILLVGDALASSEPANVLFLVFLFRPYARLHANLVQARSFG